MVVTHDILFSRCIPLSLIQTYNIHSTGIFYCGLLYVQLKTFLDIFRWQSNKNGKPSL